MRASYKQKCIVCRKNHALVTWKNRMPICVECGMKRINKPITEEPYKTLFDIDQALYEKSSFLRNIKSSYLQFGTLSEKQIETFKQVAQQVKDAPEKAPAKNIPEGQTSDL